MQEETNRQDHHQPVSHQLVYRDFEVPYQKRQMEMIKFQITSVSEKKQPMLSRCFLTFTKKEVDRNTFVGKSFEVANIPIHWWICALLKARNPSKISQRGGLFIFSEMYFLKSELQMDQAHNRVLLNPSIGCCFARSLNDTSKAILSSSSLFDRSLFQS